jgi:hypothetical protein
MNKFIKITAVCSCLFSCFKFLELYDYNNFIKEDSLFSTCGHLNKKGAAVFTRMIIEQHFGINAIEK